MVRLCFRLVLLLFLAVSPGVYPANAGDIVVTNAQPTDKDRREEYPLALLQQALKRTVASHGSFEVRPLDQLIQRKRALSELKSGGLDVYVAAVQPQWETETLPIYIPLRKGILGYRLFLVHRDQLAAFGEVQSVEHLKGLRLGSGAQWSITQVFRELGFRIETSPSYDGLFRMLANKRFDFFPRGVSEVFKEVEARASSYPEIAVETRLALYIPLPTYFFVSPRRPELRDRLEAGLRDMMADGSFEALFLRFNGENLEKAALGNPPCDAVAEPVSGKPEPD